MEFLLYPKSQFGIDTSDSITYESLYNESEAQNLKSLSDQVQNSTIPKSTYYKDFDHATFIPSKKFKNEPELIFFGTISMKPGIDKCGS